MRSTLEPPQSSTRHLWTKAVQALTLSLILLGGASLYGQVATATTPAAVAPAKNPGDVLNQDLPRWMRFSAEFRSREEGRTSFSFKEGADDTYTLTRTRIGLDLKPTKWFHFFVQGQDSRVVDIDKSRTGARLGRGSDFP